MKGNTSFPVVATSVEIMNIKINQKDNLASE